jgi:hypothetical protein
LTVYIKSPTQLNTSLNKIINDVMKEVSDDITNALQKRILLDTYQFGGPNKFYFKGTKKPTFEFLHSFKWHNIKKLADGITREMYYDYLSMRFDSYFFLHGSYAQGDMRRKLADALNITGIDNGTMGGKERRPFWDNFIKEMFDGDDISYFFHIRFSKYI